MQHNWRFLIFINIFVTQSIQFTARKLVGSNIKLLAKVNDFLSMSAIFIRISKNNDFYTTLFINELNLNLLRPVGILKTVCKKRLPWKKMAIWQDHLRRIFHSSSFQFGQVKLSSLSQTLHLSIFCFIQKLQRFSCLP